MNGRRDEWMKGGMNGWKEGGRMECLTQLTGVPLPLVAALTGEGVAQVDTGSSVPTRQLTAVAVSCGTQHIQSTVSLLVTS